MNLKMIRLSKPNPDNLFSNYENQLEPQYFFTSSVSKTLFENSQRTLLQISEDEIRNYINNDDLCNDEEGMFPKRSVLTGEWYIRSVSLKMIFFRLKQHCLELILDIQTIIWD